MIGPILTSKELFDGEDANTGPECDALSPGRGSASVLLIWWRARPAQVAQFVGLPLVRDCSSSSKSTRYLATLAAAQCAVAALQHMSHRREPALRAAADWTPCHAYAEVAVSPRCLYRGLESVA